MAKTYLEIQKQIETLQREAEVLKQQEADGVLARIKEAIAIYGFTAADLGLRGARGAAGADSRKGAKKKQAKSSAGSAPKYGDGDGNVWSGRGPRPAWFKAALDGGKTAESLLV